MKKIQQKNKFKKFLIKLSNFVVYTFPRILLFLVLVLIIRLSLNYLLYNKTENLNEIINLFLSGIILAATLAILGFTYAMAVKGKDSILFKEALKTGELFFHSTVSLIFALILSYGAIYINDIPWSHIDKLRWPFIIFANVFFLYAFTHFYDGIVKIENVLFKKID